MSSWKAVDEHRVCLPPQQDYRCSAVSLFFTTGNERCSLLMDGMNTLPFGSKKTTGFLL